MSQIINQLPCNGNNPIQLVGSLASFNIFGTGIRYFPKAPGISINSSNVVILGANAISSGIGFLTVPGNGRANGQRLTVRAGGDFTIGNTGGPSPAVTIGLYPVSYNQFGPAFIQILFFDPIVSQTFAASSDLGGYYPWNLIADFSGNSNSGLVQTLSSSIAIDGVAGSPSPNGLVAGLSQINMSAPTPFGFVLGVTFSTQDFSTIANLYQFDLQM
jgi:hypothetical protein